MNARLCAPTGTRSLRLPRLVPLFSTRLGNVHKMADEGSGWALTLRMLFAKSIHTLIVLSLCLSSSLHLYNSPFFLHRTSFHPLAAIRTFFSHPCLFTLSEKYLSVKVQPRAGCRNIFPVFSPLLLPHILCAPFSSATPLELTTATFVYISPPLNPLYFSAKLNSNREIT